jgi:hypothetical protein
MIKNADSAEREQALITAESEALLSRIRLHGSI